MPRKETESKSDFGETTVEHSILGEIRWALKMYVDDEAISAQSGSSTKSQAC